MREDPGSSIRVGFGVRGGSVNVRNLRPHRPQVGGELAAVMDAVIIREPDQLRARHLEIPEEVEAFRHLVGTQGTQLLELARERLLVKVDEVADRLELRGGSLLSLRVPFELAVRNAV